MKYDPNKHHRRSIRLKGYDYSWSGAYFVTICVQHRACLFGEIWDGKMHLNDVGQMVQEVWQMLPERFPDITLEAFVVMPNHVHGIIRLVSNPVRVSTSDTLTDNPAIALSRKRGAKLGDVIGAFKSISTHQYTIGVKQQHWEPFNQKLWQRNYYEHIIHDAKTFQRIQHYIQTNPQRWQFDQLHPDHPAT
ncbi:MAG: transposase [Oscillatoriales cyanobacterium C42_A2020_001]|nr:transposase [Leptolyngbyaceae cyanobacterium C42_A2020_001]